MTPEYSSTYYNKNKEYLKQKMREYYKNNKEKLNEAGRLYREQNYEQDILIRCRSNARRYSTPFDLELTDIVIPDLCVYLEIPLTRTQGQGRLWTNASIDRIVPEKGYVKGNIQIISELANRMKQNASLEQLLIFAKNAQRIHGHS